MLNSICCLLKKWLQVLQLRTRPITSSTCKPDIKYLAFFGVELSHSKGRWIYIHTYRHTESNTKFPNALQAERGTITKAADTTNTHIYIAMLITMTSYVSMLELTC